MADKLPPFPKLKGRRIQRDSAGNIIYENHFRNLKEIQAKYKQKGLPTNHPLVLKETATYSKMVLAYDKMANAKSKSRFKLVAIMIMIAAAAYAFVFLTQISINDIKNLIHGK